MLMKFGIAINMGMIMIDMTMSSSIRVKPRWAERVGWRKESV